MRSPGSRTWPRECGLRSIDSEGVALVDLLRGGSDVLEEMRERTRDLGIVRDEALARDARTAPDRAGYALTGDLGQPDPGSARGGAGERRSVGWLADVAGKAGIAWERLFDAPEEKSLRTLRYCSIWPARRSRSWRRGPVNCASG
jgi:hypothetical protein